MYWNLETTTTTLMGGSWPPIAPSKHQHSDTRFWDVSIFQIAMTAIRRIGR